MAFQAEETETTTFLLQSRKTQKKFAGLSPPQHLSCFAKSLTPHPNPPPGVPGRGDGNLKTFRGILLAFPPPIGKRSRPHMSPKNHRKTIEQNGLGVVHCAVVLTIHGRNPRGVVRAFRVTDGRRFDRPRSRCSSDYNDLASPQSIVAAARQISKSMVPGTKRTLPSPKPALTPPL